LVGCEVAGFLASRDRKVWIIEAEQEIAGGVNPLLRRGLLGSLKDDRISIRRGVRRFYVEDGKMLVEDGRGEQEGLQFDTIVTCTGYVSDRRMAETMTGNGFECFSIGDCLEPRGIAEAIHEGFQIGIRI
jgi:2-enoate reductase